MLQHLSLLTALIVSATPKDEELFGVFKVDVVSLLAEQKTEEGKQDIFAVRNGYRYQFVTDQHRKAFLAAPGKYEVQLGGACGKMAELSGRGSTERYWVHKGKLYVFASDGCRTSFQQDPEGHLETDDAKPQATQDQMRKGRELVDLAAKWSGIDRVAKSGHVATLQESTLKQGSQTYTVKGTTRVHGNGDYYDLTTYNGSGYGNRIDGGKAFEIDPKGASTLHVPAWKRALERQRDRNLAYLLLSRKSRGFTSSLVGEKHGVAEVSVYLDGIGNVLRIERATGKVLSQTSTGRNRFGILGAVERTFTVYETANGVTYPVAWTAKYNGEDAPTHYREKMKLEVALK